MGRGFDFLVKIPPELIDLIILQIQDNVMSLIMMNLWRCINVAWLGEHILGMYFLNIFWSRISPVACQLHVPPREFLWSTFVHTRHFLGRAPKSSVSKRFASACIPINCGCCCWQAIRYMGHKVFYCSMHWSEKKIIVKDPCQVMWLNGHSPQVNISLSMKRVATVCGNT